MNLSEAGGRFKKETGGLSMNEESITGIYCHVDDFSKALERYCKTHLLPHRKVPKWFPTSQLSLSEVMIIILLFHLSGCHFFKWYYQGYVCVHMRKYFPTQVSYNRFVELMGCALLSLLVYTRGFTCGTCTGISFID
jgi:hypothetical protein